jgi:hypothetical protein
LGTVEYRRVTSSCYADVMRLASANVRRISTILAGSPSSGARPSGKRQRSAERLEEPAGRDDHVGPPSNAGLEEPEHPRSDGSVRQEIVGRHRNGRELPHVQDGTAERKGRDDRVDPYTAESLVSRRGGPAYRHV